MTTITLDESEVASFIRWRKFQDQFELLVENRVFDVKNGSATINFSPTGDISSIDINMKVFRAVVIHTTPGKVVVDKKVRVV